MTVNPTQLASEVTRTALAAHAYTLAGGICACGLDLEETHGNYQAARLAHAAEVAARALADAGLLAPAPLHMVRTNAAISATGALVFGYPTHEFVKYQTDWLPADGVDRSEGGKAATDA